MPRAAFRWTRIFALGVSLAACTGSTGSGFDASTDVPTDAPSLTVSQFCTGAIEALMAMTCAYRGRCCTPFERSMFDVQDEMFPFTYTCVPSSAAMAVAQCTAAVTNFTPADGTECLTWIQSLQSNQFCNGPDPVFGQMLSASGIGACQRLMGPDAGSAALAGPGTPCATTADCSHDTFCAPMMTDAGSAMACRFRQTNGNACTIIGYGVNTAPECRSGNCAMGTCLARCLGASQ